MIVSLEIPSCATYTVGQTVGTLKITSIVQDFCGDTPYFIVYVTKAGKEMIWKEVYSPTAVVDYELE